MAAKIYRKSLKEVQDSKETQKTVRRVQGTESKTVEVAAFNSSI